MKSLEDLEVSERLIIDVLCMSMLEGLTNFSEGFRLLTSGVVPAISTTDCYTTKESWLFQEAVCVLTVSTSCASSPDAPPVPYSISQWRPSATNVVDIPSSNTCRDRQLFPRSLKINFSCLKFPFRSYFIKNLLEVLCSTKITKIARE